jgi:hypothetical protein
VPYAFTELNTGVLAFRKTPRWDAFCQNWLDLYERECFVLHAGTWEGKRMAVDQPAFRELLYHSDLRFTTLPSEYNCRFDAGCLSLWESTRDPSAGHSARSPALGSDA